MLYWVSGDIGVKERKQADELAEKETFPMPKYASNKRYRMCHDDLAITRTASILEDLQEINLVAKCDLD